MFVVGLNDSDVASDRSFIALFPMVMKKSLFTVYLLPFASYELSISITQAIIGPYG